MPWRHCGQDLSDDRDCPECGAERPVHLVEFDRTHVFAIGAQEGEGGEMQAAVLRTAHAEASAFCER